MTPDQRSEVAIIDLGGQYCHLIARRLRDLGVESSIYAPGVAAAKLSEYGGVILSGGPQSVYSSEAPKIDDQILRLGIPVLGICYGHQLLAQMLGGEVEKQAGEYGCAQLRLRTHRSGPQAQIERSDDTDRQSTSGQARASLRNTDTLFRGTRPTQQVWMSHSDAVTALPTGAVTIASTDRCKAAAFADVRRRLFGVQFHPEVAHTSAGERILRNFARGVCGIRKRNSIGDRVPKLVEQIRATVGDRSVFFLVSGGVDSTVAFVLCARALPRERILGLYVDTGLMRQGETEELRANLSGLGLGDRLQVEDASARFFERLQGVTDPEEKRHIIGRLFVEIQSEAMRRYGIDDQHWLLGQGTIYPDTIESGGTQERAALIKTHHNRCAEIRELIAQGRVVEPLSEFYKDEVRQIGKALGLSPRLTMRWPYPGPGLAIRCICSRARGRARALSKQAAATVRKAGFEAVLLPIQSVGVQGDGRTYRMVAALRSRTGKLDYRRLQAVGTSLCNVHSETNRVIILIAGQPGLALQKLRIRPVTLRRERVETLRRADFIVRSQMAEAGLTDAVWQFPVVIAPASVRGGETIVLRPVNSADGMTANFARLPARAIRRMAERIMQLPGIDAVFLDVTNKPPATIEWE